MIYPGLATVPVKRKPVASGNAIIQRPSQLPQGLPITRLQDEDLPALPTVLALNQKSTQQPAARPATPAPPQPPKNRFSGPAAESLAKLESIANDFQHTDINALKILAESLVFFGLLMLNWSIELRRPKRVEAIVKAILVVTFFSLHPIYCTIAVFLLCLAYGYMRLSYKISQK